MFRFKKKIFWDMDGVLFQFDNTATDFQLHTAEFYRDLPFRRGCVMQLMELLEDGQDEHFILSKVLCSEAEKGKNDALDALHLDAGRLPRHFVGGDMTKSEYVRKVMGIKLDANCILLDDHTANCIEWTKAGGCAIKVLNEINNRSRTWKGLKLSREGVILPAEVIIDSQQVVDDLVFAIYMQAKSDLDRFASGGEVSGESEDDLRRWFTTNAFGVDGRKILSAIDRKREMERIAAIG